MKPYETHFLIFFPNFRLSNLSNHNVPPFGALSLGHRGEAVKPFLAPEERHVRATTDFLVAKNVEIENAVNDAWP